MTDKTIFMPAALADAWLAALRSGEYKQCEAQLELNGSFCCLGVLEKVADGRVEINLTTGMPRTLPSFDWLDAHEVKFMSKWKTTDSTAWLPSLGMSADHANDSGKYDFPAMADAIEACLERT